MKLVAFRIVNFKSIIDTGWKDLSADNITGLIGQNESGKSSILEGLSSFYDGNLKEDALRSDGSIPSIGCSFEISDKELSELFDDYLLSNNLLSVISKNKNRINITRSWDEISTEQSKMSLEQSSLIDFFNKTEAKNKPIINSSIAPLTLTPNTIITNSLYVSPINSEQSIAQERIEINSEQFTNGIIENLPVFELFQDNTSLLPETIDIIDLKNDNPKTNGIKGAQNFLTITGLNIDDIIDGNERVIERKIRSANDKLTVDFQKFWSQYVGKSNKIEIEFNLKHHDTTNPAMAGQPYLVFWVKDGNELLHPAQRSQGVQWFLSFFLQLKANSILNKDGLILLIDEPGSRLHAKAQEDVLKLFEDIKNELQIIYTTHSPYLIDAKSLYRLLAIQRSDDDDDNSETKVLGVHHLGTASKDTLLPIYTLIGVNLQHQKVIRHNNNVILEEASAFYYLTAFKKLLKIDSEINFIPSSGVTKIPLLANLFLGWGLGFLVLTDDDDAGKKVLRQLKAELYGGDKSESDKHLIALDGCRGVEDIFSKNDFKKYVIEDQSVIYETDNSTYINKSRKSKVLSAVKFNLAVDNGFITVELLTKSTIQNAEKIFEKIKLLI